MYLNKLYKVILIVLTHLVITGATGCSPDTKIILNVSAGAGLIDAITEINEIYMEQNDSIELLNNFAASGDLRVQIENGAPADIFISAAVSEMNILEKQGLIIPETRRNIAGNKLVLITHRESKLDISGFTDLLGEQVSLFAMGDPDFVPAGSYGLQTLELLGISYKELQPKIILGNNVRQVLNYVENETVDAGIVYLTDALSSQSVKVVEAAPEIINAEIIFPAAIITSSKNLEAAIEYINFLTSTEAVNIFVKYGYAIIDN
ncbi:MAG: molybdate ABC transporter substrate-binding protein [Bacillota bacterium]